MNVLMDAASQRFGRPVNSIYDDVMTLQFLTEGINASHEHTLSYVGNN